jgi:hypothetical protein
MGDALIECSGTADCSHCAEERRKLIEEWIELHNPICILCDEKPPCYICATRRCKEWWKDDGFNREMGTYYGCRKSVDRTYCQDFPCKHGFMGWWEKDWKMTFLKRCKAIEKELLKNLCKKEDGRGTNDDRRPINKRTLTQTPKRTPIPKRSSEPT